MKRAIYPGTFDPPTLGHYNIVQRAAGQCDSLVIAIGENRSKLPPTFLLEERVRLFESITRDIPNCTILPFKGLLVDCAHSLGIDVVIRAIRTIFDFETETLQAQMNRQLGNIETFYLVVDEKYRLISSTLVREIASYGRRLTGFVPDEIEEEIFQRLSQKRQVPQQ